MDKNRVGLICLNLSVALYHQTATITADQGLIPGLGGNTNLKLKTPFLTSWEFCFES